MNLEILTTPTAQPNSLETPRMSSNLRTPRTANNSTSDKANSLALSTIGFQSTTISESGSINNLKSMTVPTAPDSTKSSGTKTPALSRNNSSSMFERPRSYSSAEPTTLVLLQDPDIIEKRESMDTHLSKIKTSTLSVVDKFFNCKIKLQDKDISIVFFQSKSLYSVQVDDEHIYSFTSSLNEKYPRQIIEIIGMIRAYDIVNSLTRDAMESERKRFKESESYKKSIEPEIAKTHAAARAPIHSKETETVTNLAQSEDGTTIDPEAEKIKIQDPQFNKAIALISKFNKSIKPTEEASAIRQSMVDIIVCAAKHELAITNGTKEKRQNWTIGSDIEIRTKQELPTESRPFHKKGEMVTEKSRNLSEKPAITMEKLRQEKKEDVEEEDHVEYSIAQISEIPSHAFYLAWEAAGALNHKKLCAAWLNAFEKMPIQETLDLFAVRVVDSLFKETPKVDLLLAVMTAWEAVGIKIEVAKNSMPPVPNTRDNSKNTNHSSDESKETRTSTNSGVPALEMTSGGCCLIS